MRLPVRITALMCVLSLWALAQTPVTVERLVEFVKSSVNLKLQDKDVALQVAGMRLTQKLSDDTIEDLQTHGAGPRTVAALIKLADQSQKLAAAPPPPPPKPVPTGGPPPSKEEQERILREVREYALNYTKSLPDFLCWQTTRRSIDMHYQPGGTPSWTPTDTIAEQLNFVDHRENYKPISRNGTSLYGKTSESFGGALSRGEWASLMGTLFEPQTETNFRWLRWGNIDGKKQHVFEYSVDKAHSFETLDVEKEKITPAFHGLVYVPVDANIVWWITVEPEIPAGFPMQDVKETLKYNYAEISGQKFILPVSSDVVMRVGRVGNHNEIEFRRYQKYSADVKFTVDDSDEPAKP